MRDELAGKALHQCKNGEANMKINTRNFAAFAAAANGDAENVIVASTPGGIEEQERRGQASLLASTDMPIKLRPSREAFEELGFAFGAPIDTLFMEAKLPDGWTRRASGNAMWTFIHDEFGKERVEVFYKAAFYDRRAHARVVGSDDEQT